MVARSISVSLVDFLSAEDVWMLKSSGESGEQDAIRQMDTSRYFLSFISFSRRFTRVNADLSCGSGDVAGTGAECRVLARCLDFNLPVTLVAFFVEWVIAEHVLRAQLSRDLPECGGQR